MSGVHVFISQYCWVYINLKYVSVISTDNSWQAGEAAFYAIMAINAFMALLNASFNRLMAVAGWIDDMWGESNEKENFYNMDEDYEGGDDNDDEYGYTDDEYDDEDYEEDDLFVVACEAIK